MARGRFIVFEGIDGSGKSTTLAAVAQTLRAEGFQVHVTAEETDGPAGRAVRDAIKGGASPLAITYLFLADRAAHAKEIEAALAAGTHVLCDRYRDSTFAYQSVALEDTMAEPLAWLEAIHAPIRPGPDHVLLFKADVEKAVARATKRGATTPYEKVAFLARVQDVYLRLAQDDAFTILDAEAPLEALIAEATATVRALLA